MAKPPRKKQFRKKQPKEFQEEVIQVDRVTRVTKGGRQLRFRATVIIGDKKGRVGYGIGKATEVQLAIQKAVTKAKKRLITIPIYEGTIPHTVQVKFKASKILIKPAGKGTGIIAGSAARKMLDLAGVSNVLSKSLGSNNRLNLTKATFEALQKLRLRPELETDQEKKKKKVEKKNDLPTIKKISRKEAKERVNADKIAPKKKVVAPTPAKETPKKEVKKEEVKVENSKK
jgi:small subunit ribosomal protein S5